MKLVGLMPCRNESWILGFSLRAALRWCDAVCVLDHCSTDNSREIIHQVATECPGRVMFTREDNPIWEEMRHRQSLLTAARALGATHIALIDADEILTANMLSSVRLVAERLGLSQMLDMPWICLSNPLYVGNRGYYSSGMWAHQRVSTAFKDDSRYHWVANNGYDFHHRAPYGTNWRSVPAFPGGGLMHLQFASRRRLLAKQYLYQLTERLRWPEREPPRVMAAKYIQTVTEAVHAQTQPCPMDWWEGYEDLMQYLDVDAEPWQEAECREILAENPGIEQGLNDFGLFAKI